MSYTPASLASYFVFNAEFSKSEDDEDEKILFYHPESLETGRKIRNIGLAQGLINFTSTFSPEKLCEAVHMNKHTQSFLQVEPDYWIVLTINNPTVKKKNNAIRHKEDEIGDEILHYTTQRSYTMFKLFYGTMTEIVANHGVEKLRALLNDFYTKYIPLITFEDLDVFDSLEGINFMPVDKNLYLSIICFIHSTNNAFPQIKDTVFFYKDHLVYSGLEQEDIRVLYRFLVKIAGISSDSEQSYTGFIPISNQNGFKTGPSSLDDSATIVVPEIFINDPPERVYLVLYKRKDITCAYLFETCPQSIDLFRSLNQAISGPIDTLSPVISDYFINRKQLNDDTYKYIYFNHMNLALKTSFKKGITLYKDTLRQLNQMHCDFASNPDNINEQIIHAGTNRWLVGKKSESREVYLIFEDKKTNLNDVSEELRKLHSTLFNNLFIDC